MMDTALEQVMRSWRGLHMQPNPTSYLTNDYDDFLLG